MGILATHVIGRLKSLYLTGKFGFKRLRVAQCNVVNPGLPSNKVFPGSGGIQTKGTDGTYSRNYNSIIRIVCQTYFLSSLSIKVAKD
jgi:hypothetical protein